MIYNIFNEFHLGDNVYQMHWNKKIIDNYPDIIINYYCHDRYIRDLLALTDDKYLNKINILSINNKPSNAINSWIGHNNFYYNYIRGNLSYNELYIAFWSIFSNQLGLNNPINSNDMFLFDDYKLLVKNQLTDKIDILLINSIPYSGQIQYDERNFNNFIDKYSEKYRIVTTNKSNNSNVPCTLDYNLSLIDIGNLSINSKFNIGIHTAPIIYCFNKYNNYNENINWYVLQQYGLTYTLNNNTHNRNNITNIEL